MKYYIINTKLSWGGHVLYRIYGSNNTLEYWGKRGENKWKLSFYPDISYAVQDHNGILKEISKAEAMMRILQ